MHKLLLSVTFSAIPYVFIVVYQFGTCALDFYLGDTWFKSQHGY